MKNYKIDFDLLNKQVYMSYNGQDIIASNINFTADLVSSYAFYPNIKNEEIADDTSPENEILDYYTLEWFSSEEHYIFIQRHSLTDVNKKVLEKDVELHLSIFTKDFMDNEVTFQDLYSIFVNNTDLYNRTIREGFLDGIIDMCRKRRIDTTLTLR